MRKGVGALVQFSIAQAVLAHLRGDGVRACLGLLFDALLEGQCALVLGMVVVEALQQLRTLTGGHDIKLRDRHLRRLLKRINHAFHRPLQVGAYALRLDARGRLRSEAERLAQVIDAQHQRVVAALLRLQHFNALPGFAGCLRRCAVAIIEQGVEQRRRRLYAAATLGQRQRCMFVAHQGGQALVGGAHRTPHVLVVQIETQRQCVNENAQRPLRGLGAQQAAHQYGAEHHARLPGQACQHLCPAQMEQAGDADPEGSRLGAQTLAQQQVKRNAVLFKVIAVAAQVLQAISQGRLVEVGEHLAEKRFMFFFADTQQRLPHVVAKRHRHTQRVGLAEQAGLYFMPHHFKGAVVHRDVVEQQRGLHPMTVRRRGFMTDQTHQRRLAQVHRDACASRYAVDLQFSVTPDHLHRGVQPVPMHGGAQDVVAIDDRLQCLGERLQTWLIGKSELHLHDIRIALSGGHVVIQNALLQGRQRIKVLHIGSPSRYQIEQTINRDLIKLDQRQHPGRDPLAARHDAIGRQYQRPAFATAVIALFDEFDQRWLVGTQMVQQTVVAQGTAIALHHQLSILDRQLDIVSFQCCQKFVDAHRIISMFSVMAA
ncbi:Uncharacterized protein AC506_5189 [Pseudomonas syringae pv. maculicola str. M6]|nr:Uncharacterized protein AC506_5189 [Pseudomonas syringae pv. maculicola str. M6]